MKCTKCGKNGHNNQNCWSEIRCGKCGSLGHPKKWCKNNSPSNFDSSKQCNYCGRRGHNEEDCKENMREDKVESSQKINFACSIIQEYSTNITCSIIEENLPSKLWILDTGESFHTTGCKDGLFNFRYPEEDHFVIGGYGGRVSRIEFF